MRKKVVLQAQKSMRVLSVFPNMQLILAMSFGNLKSEIKTSHYAYHPYVLHTILYKTALWWPRGVIVKVKNKNWKNKIKIKTKTKAKTKMKTKTKIKMKPKTKIKNKNENENGNKKKKKNENKNEIENKK